MGAPKESEEKRAFGIGWEFVQEYYTVMHDHPDLLYKFYGNNSYFCYGLESDSTPYCHGKAEIKKRISDIDYKDCKVVVSNVDSQPSNDGGIIVQVLGEMLNRDDQAIKFAQTFFLAVQPGGFYVLNAIFRHLKDEINDECEELIQQTEEEKDEVKKEPAKVEESPAKQEKAEDKEIKPVVEETKPTPAKEKKSETASTNAKQSASNNNTVPAQKPTPVANKEATAPAAAAAAAKETPAGAPKPTVAKVAAAAAETKPATAPAPSRPMTYSSIASSNTNGTKAWSKTTVVVKQPAAPTQKQQDSRNNNNSSSNNNQDKDSHTVFLKLPFTISKDEISNALNKFGDIKNIEINGQKNYAFVEFATVEQARKAVQNGEFMVKNTKINIEERKRNNKNHGNGRMNSSYSNRGGRGDYNRNYSSGSRGSNDSNNMGSRRVGSNNGNRKR
ncbi:hypothetical protein BCR32DRAFT_293771 [Anaeromyces robustus]|uniref:NTF2-domain-containing protein n=1 Tax=Anaeromyces robustus TaxID=1754192 RepID=A0A1Y1X443_9FUNG|nr:hypothetical protein BCR32DRAFT_293771 [Anaeromyces robustus]|eukprot:ORX80587.1 hypothetical protein BCR32DRAFT_293771 [Anaeromyces robustus]